MSLRAPAGPHEPGAYDATRGGSVSSGVTAFHAEASPSGRVNSERSPIRASWMSRTYGGSGFAPGRPDSGSDTTPWSRSRPGPGFLAARDSSISPSPAIENDNTLPAPDS